jgi:hypothetical protein
MPERLVHGRSGETSGLDQRAGRGNGLPLKRLMDNERGLGCTSERGDAGAAMRSRSSFTI